MSTETLSNNLDENHSAAVSPLDISLNSCSPKPNFQPSNPVITTQKIRRARRDEAFTTVGEPRLFSCLIDRKRDNWGNISGEDYYPVISDLQNQVGSSIRSVAFHPCVSSSGETFIYPQKLDPPNMWANPWNASLAEVFSIKQGLWRIVRSDKAAQCYHHEVVILPIGKKPEYPAFQDDLEQALTPNIITSINHPVVQKILAEQHSATDIAEIY